jgi:hypothetical protein
VGVVLLALLVACGAPAPPAPQPASPAPTAQSTDPFGLLGTWRLRDAGAESGQVVRLYVGQVVVEESPCRAPEGTWRADWYGTFVASFDTASTCPGTAAGGAPSGPDWARRAVGFRVEGDTRVLLAGSGEVVGRLVREHVVPPPYLQLYVGFQEVDFGSPDDWDRADWAPAAPPRAGTVPATPESLVGRWVPERWPPDPSAGDTTKAPVAEPPRIDVDAAGGWTGSDGCNRDGGRWRTGPDGAFVASQFTARTLIGCDGVDVGTWLVSARRAALDGPVLVLYRAAGTEIGRLVRG